MKKDFLKEAEEKLEKKKKSIEADLKRFAKKDEKTEGDWDAKYPDFEPSKNSLEESADEVEEYANLLPLEHSLELKLVEINKALDKIKKGKYGICEKCGKDIVTERLKVSPEANTCANCKA